MADWFTTLMGSGGKSKPNTGNAYWRSMFLGRVGELGYIGYRGSAIGSTPVEFVIKLEGTSDQQSR